MSYFISLCLRSRREGIIILASRIVLRIKWIATRQAVRTVPGTVDSLSYFYLIHTLVWG